MLSELTIHNVAVIAEADICFQRGLNVFTGETGAGKSILIGAIGAVLGGRTSKDLIRTGAGSASVTALFTNIAAHTEKALSSLGFEIIEGEVLLSRELTPDGTACRINGHPVTVAMLRTAGSFLINTHGQQDNQMLASTDSHRGFLDAFGALEQIISKYRLRYDALCTLENRLATIETDENAKAQQMDLLHYQIDEIEAADLTDGEEEEMASRRRIIRNAAALTTLLSRSREIITGSEEVPGVLSLLDRATADLTQAGRVLRELQTAAERVEGFRCELDDLASQLRDSLDQLEYDPRELDDLEERIDLIGRLKKKYGGSISEILEFCSNCKTQLDEIERSEQTLDTLKSECIRARQAAVECAVTLTEARQAAAGRFVQAVTAELAGLDMPSLRFEVRLTPRVLCAHGAEDAEFLLSVNPGEAPRPLAKIASGGEMSRVMLGIKSVLSRHDDIDTLIFDEIDTGISGRAAQKVGRKLREVAQCRQVICVTHLAQVAACADHHLMIEKQVREGRTFTQVFPLDHVGCVREIARIASGEPITELALQSAAQLLDLSQQTSDCE